MTRSPDPACDFIIKGCLTPCSPRPHGLLIDMLLAPWYVYKHRQLGDVLDLAANWFLSGIPPPKPSFTLQKTCLGVVGVAAVSMAAAGVALAI